MSIQSDRAQKVWQKAMDLVAHICEAVTGFPASERHARVGQVQRAQRIDLFLYSFRRISTTDDRPPTTDH